MIAKRVARRAGTSNPARLVRYMVAAQGGIEPESWKRTADYILDSKGTTTQGEKVAQLSRDKLRHRRPGAGDEHY